MTAGQAQREEIETFLNINTSKTAYRLVKKLTPEKQGDSKAIQDKSGCVYQHPKGDDFNLILNWKFQIAVTSLKTEKSTGVGNVPASHKWRCIARH